MARSQIAMLFTLFLLSSLVQLGVADLIADRGEFNRRSRFGPPEPSPEFNTWGLFVLVVVWGTTRLVYALDQETARMGYIRDAVQRALGQAVTLFGSGTGRELSDGDALAPVCIARERAIPFGSPTAAPGSFVSPSDVQAVAIVTRERERERVFFPPVVRRAIYNVLINPREPCAPNAAPSAAAAEAAVQGKVPFEVGLYTDATRAKYAFVTHGVTPPWGFGPAAPSDLERAMRQLGDPSAFGVTITEAFEAWLAVVARGWTPQSVAQLPVEFLIAFGRELTPRLDVNDRIRSTRLDADTLATLRAPPFGRFVDSTLLDTFQGAARSIYM